MLGFASVRRKPGSKFYYACYTAADGTQLQKSTKSTDKKTAQKIADELEEPFRKKCTVSQLRKSFADVAKGIGTVASFGTTVRQYFTRWLDEIRGEHSPETHERYAQINRDCLVAMGPHADRPIDELDRSTIIGVRNSVAERTSPRNSNTYLKQLKRVMRAAVADELRSDNPTLKIKLLDEEEPDRAKRRPFTVDELKKLRAVLTEEWPLIVHMAEHTGQRLGDITFCTWGQLDLEAKIWAFYSEKTKRNMRVPLTPSLQSALHSMPKGERQTPIFPVAFKAKRDKNNESRALSAEFHKFMVLAGLAKKRSKANTGRGHGQRRNTNELTFHCLRHNATSNLKKAGVPEAVVRDIIGHESELVSRDYTHIDDATKVDAVKRIDDRMESCA